MTWQPIATAPRDGTAIWIAVEGHPYIGYCQPADPPLDPKDTWFIKTSFRRRIQRQTGSGAILPDEIFGCYGFDVAPTHWMPLPEPLAKR